MRLKECTFFSFFSLCIASAHAQERDLSRFIAPRAESAKPKENPLVKLSLQYIEEDKQGNLISKKVSISNEKDAKTNELKNQPKARITTEIFSRGSYDFHRKRYDIISSHLGITIENDGINLENFLKERGTDSKKSIFCFRTEISAGPSVLSDQIEEDVYFTAQNDLKHALRELGLAEDMISSILQTYIGPVREEIANRVDDLIFETSIQSVVFDVGFEQTNGAKLFASIGKEAVRPGSRTNANGFTSTDYFTAQKNIVQGAGGTASTGSIHLGQSNKENTQKVDLWIFANRSPFYSTEQYVSTRLQQDDETYNQERQWWELNSAVLGLSNKISEEVEVHYYFGSYDGAPALGVGSEINVTETILLALDLHHGKRDELKEGLSCTIKQEVGNGFYCYGRYDSFDEKYDYVKNTKLDYEQLSIGVGFAKNLLSLDKAIIQCGMGIECQSGFDDRSFDEVTPLGWFFLKTSF